VMPCWCMRITATAMWHAGTQKRGMDRIAMLRGMMEGVDT
jgi:hypothetical protein